MAIVKIDVWQPELMDKTYKFADYIAKSDIIPKAFQGKPANVFIACQIAQRLNTNPMEIMQNMQIVYGNPAFKSSYLIGRANTECFKSPISYEESGEGENLFITAKAELKSGGLACATVSYLMAKQDGWTAKNQKYQTMPIHMLRYRAAAFLIRQYCPEITFGFPTEEEVEDVEGSKTKSKTSSEAGGSLAKNLNQKFAQIQPLNGEVAVIIPKEGEIQPQPNEGEFERCDKNSGVLDEKEQGCEYV